MIWLVFFQVFGENYMLNQIRTFYGLIIEYDQRGNVTKSLHDPTGEHVKAVSQVLDIGNEIYLGSFFSPYMLKLDFI